MTWNEMNKAMKTTTLIFLFFFMFLWRWTNPPVVGSETVLIIILINKFAFMEG